MMMIDAGLTFAALVLPSGARSYELAGLRCIAASRRDERTANRGGWRTPNGRVRGVEENEGEDSRVAFMNVGFWAV